MAAHLLRKVCVRENGDASVLKVEPLDLASMQVGEKDLLVRVSYAGVNFIDTYYRTGLYKKPLPFVPGDEGSGGVVKVGAGVPETMLGKRVAFFRSSGSYAAFTVVPSNMAFEVPEGVSDADAAALMLQGCTAHYLTTSCFPVGPGHTVLVHAAAGGTGNLICQISKMKGATVIATCGGSDKVELTRAVADHVIDYKADGVDWPKLVKEICPKGVDVVFDGVGKATFLPGLTVLRPRGHMVTFGNASGAVDPIAPLQLTAHGSIVLQRPSLKDFQGPEEIIERVTDLMQWVRDGKLKLRVGAVFPLDRAGEAHIDLEGRKTVGKVLINCQE